MWSWLLVNNCEHFQDSSAYEDWRHWRFPNILEVLEEFPSVRPQATLLIAQLNVLQPRFYSISSSPRVHKGQVHLTVAVVTFRTEGKYSVLKNTQLNSIISIDFVEDHPFLLRVFVQRKVYRSIFLTF